MAIGVFLPIGFLDLQSASNFWWLLNILALIVLGLINSQQNRPAFKNLLLVWLLVSIFPSTVTHLDLGQISLLICLAITIVIWFDDRLPDWGIGALLAFALIKPQLSLVFLPAYAVKVYRAKGWKATIRLGLWTCAAGLIFSLPVILIQPDWTPDFLANLAANPTWAHPSIHVLLFRPLGKAGQVLSFVYIAVGIGISLLYVARNQGKSALLWVLALTTVISPYIWSWDFVLIYPLMIHVVSEDKPVKKSLLIVPYFLVLCGYVIIKLTDQVNDIYSWWIPWSLLLSTGLVQHLSAKTQGSIK
jgi:hypothetical protein